MRKFILLALGAGLVTLGLAPAALADNPDVVNICSSSDTPTGPSTGGQGLIAVFANDNTTPFTCPFTAKKAAEANVVGQSLNAWTVKVGTVTVASQPNLVNQVRGGAAPTPTVQKTFAIKAGNVVKLTVTPDCAGGQCGASGEFVIGSS